MLFNYKSLQCSTVLWVFENFVNVFLSDIIFRLFHKFLIWIQNLFFLLLNIFFIVPEVLVTLYDDELDFIPDCNLWCLLVICLGCLCPLSSCCYHLCFCLFSKLFFFTVNEEIRVMYHFESIFNITFLLIGGWVANHKGS